jgi:protocatechuate 3,4-dioxygenase alpha subunit
MAPHQPLDTWHQHRRIPACTSPDEEEANANDPVLNGIEWEVRRKTVSANAKQAPARWYIDSTFTCQGPEETVFFDI